MPTAAPRLFLITPPIRDAAAFAPSLEAALAACEIACVLLRPGGADESENGSIIRALVPLVQRRGAAALIEGDAQFAISANADGCHLEGTEESLRTARAALHPGRIAGAGGLANRHAAMTAGETGVDYLMFGGPAGAESHARIVEEVAWWAEIFTVPCVGYAHVLTDVGGLAEAGADFIALGDAVFEDPRGVAAALAGVAAFLARSNEKAL